MIQEQARQLLEKETVIRDQLELCQTLQERNGQKVAKIDELRDKIAALKLKNDNLKAKR
jgi:hypothetical protein